MDVRFADDDLDRLETDPRFTARLPAETVRAYRKVLNFIRQAADEREFRSWPGLHFEKLVPDREGQHSLRLNRQWRLIIQLEGEGPNKIVAVCEVDNYHRD